MQIIQNAIKIQEFIEQRPEPTVQEATIKLKDSKFSFGQWSEKQTFKYFLFVFHHKQKFQSKSMRKSLKVFKQMARFIKSRNSSQCRTHHQNLMSKSKCLENALMSFIEENPNFYNKYQTVKNILKILDDMDFCEDTSTVVREAKHDGVSEQESSSTNQSNKSAGDNKNQTFIITEPPKTEIISSDKKLQKMLQCQLYFTLWANKVAGLSQAPLC